MHIKDKTTCLCSSINATKSYHLVLIILHSIKYMRKSVEVINKRRSNQVKNGSTRIQTTSEGIKHLEIFQNGSWQHDQRCKSNTNKECKLS